MNRKLSFLVAASLLAVSLPTVASAQLAEESAEATIPEPVNQTANVTVAVSDGGSATVTLDFDGNVTNETVAVTVPEDALGLLPFDPVQFLLDLCDSVAQLLFGPGGRCF